MGLEAVSVNRTRVHDKCRRASVLDTFGNLVDQTPTLTAHERTLLAHHRASGIHVLRTTLAAIYGAHQLGWDPMLAGIVTLGHDSGKRKVWWLALRGILPPPITKLWVREPHIQVTREDLRATPDREFAPYGKQNLMAIILSHHDLLANGNGHDQYPRRRTLPHVPERRRTINDEEAARSLLLWKVYLALMDKLDRMHHGFRDNGISNLSTLHRDLSATLSHAPQPIQDIMLPSYLPAMERATVAITDDMVTEATHMVGNPSRLLHLSA